MLAEKLHPSRFTDMSPKMAAIVGYIIGESWAKPELLSIHITSDGFVIGRTKTPEGEIFSLDLDEMGLPQIGKEVFIGDAYDLEHNVKTLLDAAELDEAERTEFYTEYATKVHQ